MKIVFMGNNWVGWQVVKWLRKQGETIEGLVLHPPEKRKYAEEIIEAADIPDSRVFDGSAINEAKTVHSIAQLSPDIGLSIFFGFILKKEILAQFPQGVVNLHPAFLPYNRGQYPNVWSIIEGTPAGVTLHFIDEEIDTGDIIARKEVGVEPVDTGESLYRKLEQGSVELFKSTWPLIKAGRIQGLRQDREKGTFHHTSDIRSIDEINLDRDYKALDLINILRARTFPPFQGAYFVADGRKVFMRLQLDYEENQGEPHEGN